MGEKSIAARLLVHLAEAGSTTEEPTMGEIVINVGADIGNATSIVAVQAEGGKVTVTRMPTALAFSLSVPARLERDDHVFFDAHGLPSIAVGMAALRYSDGEVITARGSRERYGEFLADFLVAGIAAQVKGERITVRTLAITVPAKHYATAAPAVTKALKRTHTRSYRGRPVVIEVKAVKVYRESEAALAHVATLAKGNTILIDGGGGQTHVATARDGQLRGEPVTRETGFQRVIDKADDVINARHGRRLSSLERYELEYAMAAKRPYAITVDGAAVRVDGYAEEKVAETARLIIADIQSIVPKWASANTVLLGGGQAHHLAREYRASFPQLVVADRPVEWNALGALRLAGLAVELDEVA
jgi:hypothetical protein